MSFDKSVQVLTVLNDFILHILVNMDPSDTFIMTSDHGNIEDLSVKTHTRNPVPLFVKGDTEPFKKAESILDVTPGIIEVLRKVL
jgi:bisphosphoglycerate-independent phosphoglycerate mutase (AlkP superfamily)